MNLPLFFKNRHIKLNISELQKRFKKPIYKQEEYWDAIYGVIGKRTQTTREDFVSNGTFTAYIDGGDTAQRQGMYYTGLRLLELNGYDTSNFLHYSYRKQEEILSSLYCDWTWGLYRRHPDPNMWYGDQFRGSRDNMKPLVSAEAFLPTETSTKRLSLFILRNLFLDSKTKRNGATIENHGKNSNFSFKFPNLMGPTMWAAYIRAAIQKSRWFLLLYPLLLLFDIEIVVNSIIKQSMKVDYKDGTKDYDNDVSNHVIYSVWFGAAFPTPWIYLMNKYLNSQKHFVSMLYDYHDDGRESFTLPIIWETLIYIYFERD